jgi:DNA-directed RNA polymerase specialized sigma24 family protein
MAKMRDDQNLVARFRTGDKAAFEQIVEQYDSDVAGLVYRLLGWSGEVDDVTQDVFLAVYRHLHRFRGDCSLKSWIFAIKEYQKVVDLFPGNSWARVAQKRLLALTH